MKKSHEMTFIVDGIRCRQSDGHSYLLKIPTLDSTLFPDDICVFDLINMPNDPYGFKNFLKHSGLTDKERSGIGTILDISEQVKLDDENGNSTWVDVTLGFVRQRTFEQLLLLRDNFSRGCLSRESVRKLKRLCGGVNGLEKDVSE